MPRRLMTLFLVLACTTVGLNRAQAEEAPHASVDELALLLARYTDKAEDLIHESLELVGVEYRRGGTAPEDGFDCSGFVQWVFKASIDEALPRTTKAQSRVGRVLKRNELKPGDLIFFNTMRRAFSHVGIYLGSGHFIHSPRTGGKVRVEDMRGKYWLRRYNGARRILEETIVWNRENTEKVALSANPLDM